MISGIKDSQLGLLKGELILGGRVCCFCLSADRKRRRTTVQIRRQRKDGPECF